jgi:hypothetical protein
MTGCDSPTLLRVVPGPGLASPLEPTVTDWAPARQEGRIIDFILRERMTAPMRKDTITQGETSVEQSGHVFE